MIVEVGYYYALSDSGRADNRAPSVLLGAGDRIIIEFRGSGRIIEGGGWVIIEFWGSGFMIEGGFHYEST